MKLSAVSLRAGVLVGAKYRLMRRIGAGGMGEVWVARNRMTGADVAVKMGLGAAEREDSAARFRHEARLGAMLAHRSIVRIFDLVEEGDGTAGGTLLLVMELLKGETLERYLHRRGSLPAAEAIAIVIPILSALAHAHETGIVHRDVTPANVFLAIDPDGHITPKLLDFGIAKIPSAGASHTIDGRVLGTPRYMAPERIRGQEGIDGRSDLFSVGVILFEMLTGACPFAASSPAASLAAVLEVVVDPDPRIDPRVWLELRRSLSKLAYERPATATEMATGLLAASGHSEAALTDVLRDADLSRDLTQENAGPFDPTQSVGGHSLAGAVDLAAPRRRRAVAWTAAILAVCAGLAAASEALRRRPSPTPAAALSTEGASAGVPGALVVERAAPTPPASASSAPSTTVVAPKAPARPARPARPKPVATTPGF